MNLYQLSEEWESIANTINDADGELTEEVLERLSAFEQLRGDKVDAICSLIQRFLRQSQAADAEAERLTQLAVSRANAANRLKAYLKHHLERQGLDRIETDLFRIRLQRNPRPTTTFSGDVDALPDLYREVTTTVKPNTQLALAHWREGIPLPAGFRVETGTHLRIQ